MDFGWISGGLRWITVDYGGFVGKVCGAGREPGGRREPGGGRFTESLGPLPHSHTHTHTPKIAIPRCGRKMQWTAALLALV